MCGLREIAMFSSVSAFDLLCYIVLIEVSEVSLVSFRCVVGKEECF